MYKSINEKNKQIKIVFDEAVRLGREQHHGSTTTN